MISTPRYCTFCGKSQNDVKKLVAGPPVINGKPNIVTNICDECIDICYEIVHFPDEDAYKESILDITRDTVREP